MEPPAIELNLLMTFLWPHNTVENKHISKFLAICLVRYQFMSFGAGSANHFFFTPRPKEIHLCMS